MGMLLSLGWGSGRGVRSSTARRGKRWHSVSVMRVNFSCRRHRVSISASRTNGPNDSSCACLTSPATFSLQMELRSTLVRPLIHRERLQPNLVPQVTLLTANRTKGQRVEAGRRNVRRARSEVELRIPLQMVVFDSAGHGPANEPSLERAWIPHRAAAAAASALTTPSACSFRPCPHRSTLTSMANAQVVIRWAVLCAYAIPVGFGALFGIFSLTPLGNRADSDPAWMLMTAAYLSLASAGSVLLVWAFLIRRASKSVWAKGTEVLREVFALCLISLGAFVVYNARPEWKDQANEVVTPAAVFFAVLLWAQAMGPGWANFVEAREEISEGAMPRRSRWLRSEQKPHDRELTVAESWCAWMMLYVLLLFGTSSPVPQIAYVYLGFLVCGTWLLLRAYSVRSATGAAWAKATQALRQVFAASSVIFVFNAALLMQPPIQKASADLVFGSILALASAGVWLIIFGPAKTAHAEVAAVLAEKPSRVNGHTRSRKRQ